MYYGTVVHTIIRTIAKNSSTYYSHDVLRASTTKHMEAFFYPKLDLDFEYRSYFEEFMHGQNIYILFEMFHLNATYHFQIEFLILFERRTKWFDFSCGCQQCHVYTSCPCIRCCWSSLGLTFCTDSESEKQKFFILKNESSTLNFRFYFDYYRGWINLPPQLKRTNHF